MRQNQQSQQFKPRTDVDLALERRGTMGDLTEAERASFIHVAELLGCHTAAQHIRDDRRRRGLVYAAPAPAPRPGPKPQPSVGPIQPPLLRAVPDDGPATETRPDPDRAWWQDVRRVAARHADSEIRPISRAALDAFQRAAQAHLT